MNAEFILDGQAVRCQPGDSILAAATRAGRYIPHLCFHPDFKAHGSCKLCTVRVDGRQMAACTTQAQPGQVVESDSEALNGERRRLLQMLFVEGNHFCPACEQSGQCQLQATAYQLGMQSPHYPHFYPNRPVDASHPDFILDLNRCILCTLCLRASRDVDGKQVFALAGRGLASHLTVDAPSGRLGDSDFSRTDRAAQVCPVGALLPKGRGFAIPIGERRFDSGRLSNALLGEAVEHASEGGM